MPLAIPASLPPDQAWQPISAADWTEANVIHFLSRTGFSSHPDEVAAALRRGLARTIARHFGYGQAMPVPERLKSLQDNARAVQEQISEVVRQRNLQPNPSPEYTALEQQRQQLENNRRSERLRSYREYAFNWLQFARQPQNSAREKFVMFLQNVWVVSYNTIQEPYALFLHQHLIRQGLGGTYPEMCKALSRSPAMIDYLNLQTSRRTAPNQNFARELMELFTLGEGNYTQNDVLEASRAFTGYRHSFNSHTFDAASHDSGPKTLFGQTGNYTGDQVIDLIFQQPAAARFLPRELACSYIAEDELPAPHLQALADRWRAGGFRLDHLIETVFSSRLFYTEAVRDNVIKDPTHFYLGLLQNLDLDVYPVPAYTLNFLNNMGMPFFTPPNVRGWLGHKLWVNATTLNARRQLADFLFNPLADSALNADDQATVQRWRNEGRGSFFITPARLAEFARLAPDATADYLVRNYLNNQATAQYRGEILAFMRSNTAAAATRTRNAFVGVLESPDYNLS